MISNYQKDEVRPARPPLLSKPGEVVCGRRHIQETPGVSGLRDAGWMHVVQVTVLEDGRLWGSLTSGGSRNFILK